MKLTEYEAIDLLKLNGIEVKDKKIVKSNLSGLKILSAIDCLVKYHAYQVIKGE